MTASAYTSACFGDPGRKIRSSSLRESVQGCKHALRERVASGCFSGNCGINASSGTGLDRRGSMVSRDRTSQVYDPTLAKKEFNFKYATSASAMSVVSFNPKQPPERFHLGTLGRTEQAFYKKHKECEGMSFPMLREDILDENLIREDALDDYLFQNISDASMQLGQERHRREVCSSKLQEIERELQEFSELFGRKFQELRNSMGEFAQSMKELIDDDNYIEDRLWEEADISSKAVDIVTKIESPPHR